MTTDDADEAPADFGWLINEFVERAPGVTQVLIMSSDGFPLIGSQSVISERAEQLAAIATAILGLARNGAFLFGMGGCELIIMRLSHGYFFFVEISADAGLAVLTSPGCDMKVAAYEMTQFVDKVRPALTPRVRADLRRVITARRAS
jgi:uncharacterized protein